MLIRKRRFCVNGFNERRQIKRADNSLGLPAFWTLTLENAHYGFTAQSHFGPVSLNRLSIQHFGLLTIRGGVGTQGATIGNLLSTFVWVPHKTGS